MRDATRSAVIAVLAVVAVAVAAATLDSTTTTERSAPGGPGGGGGGGGLLPPPQSSPPPGEVIQIPFLTDLLAVLAGIAALAVLAYAVVYWREALKVVLAIGVAFGLLFVLFQLLSSGSPAPPLTEPGNGSLLGGGGGGGSEPTQPSSPPLIVLLVLGLVLAGAVVALSRATGGSHRSDGEPDAGSDAAAVGRAAGRAADRLEQDADVDDEVYRAWREMTELLDAPDPETSTPGEFADAAVEAGLGREDVGELTRLFEDVRYGEVPPSDEYERKAIAIFRRIEDRYAGDGS